MYCTVQEVATFLTWEGFSNKGQNIVSMILPSGLPVNLLVPAHGFSEDTVVTLTKLDGAAELNDQTFSITLVDVNRFTLDGTDGDDVSAYNGIGQVNVYQSADTDGTWPDEDAVKLAIEMACGRIDAAMLSSNQYRCTKDDATNKLLKALAIVGAVMMLEYDNARTLSDAEMQRHSQWYEDTLQRIMTGQLSVCPGETGVDYPAVSTAEVAYTPGAAVNIIINSYLRRIV